MKTRPWPTAGLLTALVFVGYLPISVVSILGPILVEDLNISAPTFGLGPSLLFGGAAVITLVMAGSRAAMRQRMVGALLAAAAGWLIVSMAQGKFEYFLGLILCSGALAMCIPAVNQSAQMLVSSSARGAVVGFAQSGSQIAAIATGLLVPWGFDRLGWRSTVLIASAGAVVVAALTRFVIPSGSRNLREVPGRARTVTNRVAVRPGLWGYPLLMGIVTTPLFVYLPTHLVDVTKIDLMHAGWVVLGNAGVAMAAKILWGKLTYHTGRPACAMSVISLGTFVGYLLMALDPGNVAIVVLASFIVSLTGVSWMTVQMISILRVDHDGLARLALVTTSSGYVGMAVGPVLFGLVLAAYGYRTAWFVTSAAALVGIAAAMLYGRSQNRVVEALEVGTVGNR